MASYPLPPAAQADGGPAPAAAHSADEHGNSDASPQLLAAYGPGNSRSPAANDVIAAAHHGLQALQVATQAHVNTQSPAQPSVAQSSITHVNDNAPAQYPDPIPEYGGTGNAAPAAAVVPTGPPPPGILAPRERMTRLKKACDVCSKRKVKCSPDEVCKPCLELGVPCTWNRDLKRRGPPNRHAEAARNAKLPRLEPTMNLDSQVMSPGPQQHAAQALVAIAGHGLHDAESIAPWPCLAMLVDDFFTYIYPLMPFPHEPSFRQAFERREDRTNPEFLALLAAMIGCLAASFPRTVRQHLKAEQIQNGVTLFPKAIHMINRCRAVALEARGTRFCDKESITVYDAATSYFLGLAAGYTMQFNVCRRFMSQTMSFLRELQFHTRREDVCPETYGGPLDVIQEQVGKRIFWVMFQGTRSIAQVGAAHWDLHFPVATPAEPYPDFPADVDDEYIFTDHMMPQPDGTVSRIRGFIEAIQIYLPMDRIVSFDAHPVLRPIEHDFARDLLVHALNQVKAATEQLPRELKLDLTAGQSGPIGLPATQSDVLEQQGFQYHPPAFPAPQPPSDIRFVIANQPESKKALQYEIQKANIYLSQVATRSYVVERYFSIRENRPLGVSENSVGSHGGADAPADQPVKAEAIQAAAVNEQQPDELNQLMSAERNQIVQDMATVLASINQLHMEANGSSLISKIRQVASTLVGTGHSAPREGAGEDTNDVGTTDRPGGPAAEYLNLFVNVLVRLEKTAGTNSERRDFMSTEEEEQELRDWAELKGYRQQYLQSGGLLPA